MSASDPSSPRDPTPPTAGVSWVELAFFLFVVAGGFFFLRDAPYWGRAAYVGSAQFGDAEFWWNGALHFSQGIVKENPNLTFRMGYAAFGGLVAAVVGPDYRVFHQILLVVFLVTVCGLYGSLRGLIGRIAAAAAVVFLVFNPFTAEWLAISTSDGLGLVLNLLALLALVAGVRDGLQLRWIAVFGVFFSCASLTRPLMTPFIASAALTVIVAAWSAWRKTAIALGVMLAAFILPTVAWMAFMGATTGNFALTGASQDSSAFYAASDPLIQVWRGDMYAPVNESAQKRFQTDQPTPKQLNAEFWNLTRTNYQTHWRYHLDRLWRNAFELARFTPKRATTATIFTERWRGIFKWSLTLALTALALGRHRWFAAVAVVAVGAAWATWPPSHPWLALGASWLGLTSLLAGHRSLFLWTTYWWVGVMALYLTGGTWGPPVGPVQDLNALGYRLGFQFFFAGDLLVIGLLGCLALGAGRAALAHRLLRPSPTAGRIIRLGLRGPLVLLAALLGTGAVIVTWRLVARAWKAPVAYPALNILNSNETIHGATPLTDITPLRVAVNAHTGAPLLTRAMSSGFIWNLPGQQRSMLLLYQQDNVQPIHMSPRHIYVEISRHVPDRVWMNRQGAWLLHSFPNTAQTSNLPFYFEMPAVQAFFPLAKDGRSYDASQAVTFPLAKSATQLVASGELMVQGASPEWAMNSGGQKFPRRFALKSARADQIIELRFDLSHARGHALLRFGMQLESAPGTPPRTTQVFAHLTSATRPRTTLWESNLDSAATDPLWVERAVPNMPGLGLTVENLRPTDTLWFYELVMTADDFTQ